MNLKIAVLSGDGIGPEVTLQAKKALHAIGVVYNHEFVFEDAYIGSYPVGISYDNTCSGTSYSTELSSYEPEHCALIICMFVDKFGEKASARNRLSSSK